MKKTLPLIALLVVALPALAGFPGTDVVIPATSRAQGAGDPPAQFYSTLWVTNLSSSQTATVKISLLRQGQTNPTPTAAPDQTLEPGETKKWENVISTLFGLSGVSGALRITSNVTVFASSRTYDKPDGSDIKDAKGLFFSAIPSSFAIGLGETAFLQGVSEGGSEDYRFNYGLVEVSGLPTSESPVKVRVTLRGPSGILLSTTDASLGTFEARQWKVSSLPAYVGTTNGRLEATVVSGTGKVMLYGTLIANGSQDSAGFEMSFKDGLLAESAASATEGLAASTATTTVAAIKTTYDIAPRLITLGRPPASEVLAGASQSVLADPITGVYDPATGWWTVAVNLSTGQSSNLQVRFKDDGGVFQKFFNPLTINTIESKGDAAGLQGALNWDFVLTGTKTTSTTLTTNGSGSGNYQGISGTAAISNLVMPKTVGAWPSSGTMTVSSGGITVTLSFNGTQYATGTYTYHNQTFTFTINLLTGEVTR
jgi:hypothetical protein